ncbi:hypothetical protein ABT086_25275, partial [Streptomyces mirabilis]
MAVVMSMHWAGVTPEQYDMVRDVVGWEEVPAAGGQVHVAWFDAQGFHVTDVWESQQAFETFFTERLAPAIQKAGPASPVHPRQASARSTGASSPPASAVRHRDRANAVSDAAELSGRPLRSRACRAPGWGLRRAAGRQ